MYFLQLIILRRKHTEFVDLKDATLKTGIGNLGPKMFGDVQSTITETLEMLLDEDSNLDKPM